MAENEVLDVGSRWRYRRWREALGDANLSPAAVADCLPEEFVAILRNALRRKPLYLILKACSQDRGVLREAINNFKDRDMAKLVERAHTIARSTDPSVVARKLAELLVDKFVDRANRYALRHDHNTKGLKTLFTELNGVSPRILHSTLTTSLRGGKAIRMRQQEPTQRTRAFLFCSAAAIAADAYKLDVVEMFENGVGAINVPLMTGMLGNGLSTRGAHPTFLQMMSALSTHVTGRNIRFILPFEARTKAEMLKHLAAVPGLGIWAQESRSCVHTALRQAGKTHCGRLPACIERRQAFAVAGINEKLDVYQTNLLIDSLSDQDEADYLDLYQIEAMNWVAGNASVGRRMSNHLRLTDVSPDQDQRIQELQLRHAQEVLRTFRRSVFEAPELNASNRGIQP
ncbi:MAG: hypothetical protein A3G20_04725 [Acidobacteria bacterium RIFCSPLOWO2_12_FULL_59_11]|nr:MAG: hypothetical protein A3G20_04725 [Acidobacteria bacterium RIFCSPLOWO2_12_FULL_59_11]